MAQRMRIGSLCVLSLAAGACAPHVELEVAPQLLSTAWSQPAPGPAASGGVSAPNPANLGAAFGSQELEGLIGRALQQNGDVGVARARIQQARALFGIARGAMFPLVTASAGLSGTRTERTTSDPFDFSDAFAGVDISFDLDLFGANRARRRAEGHRLRAAEFDQGATALIVEGDVARIYVQRAALAARISLLDRNIEQAVELERIIRARANAGDATRVDLGLQTIQVRELQTDRLRLSQALDRTRTAMAVLIGEEAPRFVLTPSPLDALQVPDLAVAPPPELLVRRPDIRAAEARIDAAGGDVDAARRAFFPQLSLSASGIGQAASLSGPLAATVSLGAGLLSPIFNRGQLRGNLEFAAGQQVESVELYRLVLLTSLAETENALSAVDRARAREALLLQVVEEARVTARLARLQYMEGETDLQSLFDAEQRLVAAEDARAVAHQERLEAAIDLFKAMGGAYSPLA
ncbi:MAG: efflux transporter outer membrane subunit [Alphaproteobacteria bacterium]|nr:MAG: efflux transporter outer membrane subunit [Alphaproteobacteria bacterium]